ncbi:MAG: DUF5011 domain-containing protein [Bacilli bacterium]|nr:DUF5011 domain-containing protein [Bacilli bacterium]
MKRYFVIFNLLFFLLIIDTHALTYNEIKSRTTCANFELAEARSDKSLNHKQCFNTYDEAKNAMNSTNNDDLVILERSNNVTRIIDAKYALVYMDIGEELTYYYSYNNLTGYITYMNHSANYGATDGVFLELNYSNHAIKVKINGVVGWTRDGNYKIVPLNFLGTTSYYQVTDDSLNHFYAKDIQTTYSSYSRSLDKKPSMLNTGKYYSYDGIYFYSDLKKLITDYKNGNYNNSSNKDNPYYNYYMYLPHRGRSNYTADDIDAYLKNTKNLIGTIYGRQYVSRYSNMWASGIFFKSSETLYGGNAILMMSLATNESALGQSRIAIDKNNLFGHAAYDSSAYDSATGYLNPYQSILGHAKSYINCGYANPNDSRYRGSNMGDKSSGMNIMYASDPYWGEKAANYYYLFDKDNGFLDYNYYQLGITNIDSVNVRSEPNLTSSIPFNLKYKNVPVIILGEVNGTNVNGSTKWYKIVSDANLTVDRTSIQSCSYTNYYNYNSYVYVHSSFINKINTSSNGQYNTNSNLNDKDIKYQEYSSGAVYKPKTALINKSTEVYDTATLSVKTGITAKENVLVPVFMEASLDGRVVAYLIETDFSKNQKGWVEASSLTFKEKDLLKVNVTNIGSSISTFNTPGGSSVGSLYDQTYAVIIDSKTYNNELWIQIDYSLSNNKTWVNTNVSTSVGSLEYTLNNIGDKEPVINASDITLLINSEFNPVENVKANDEEDGDITSNVKVISNNVNTSKIGTYEVTYQVTDSKNHNISKTIKVYVVDFNYGDPLFYFESLKHVSDTKFEVKGFIGVKGMNNTNTYHTIAFINEQDITDIYEFELEDYSDYPFEMSSLDDTTKYNYSKGWFKGTVDLNKENIPEGNYYVFVSAYDFDTGYFTIDNFTNIAYIDMPRRVKANTRGISFDIDYSTSGSPMLVSIRDRGLISYTEPTSFDPTYNFFNELSLDNNNLSITGTSHSAYVSYSKNDDIKRELIFENTDNFERISYDLSYIEDGPYKVELPVSDGKDKTRAWFKKTIDLSNLTPGNYALYIKTTSNNKTYYGELVDVAYTDFSKINTSKYIFNRADDSRLRVELTVKE